MTAAVGCVRPRVRYSTEFRRPNLQGKRPVFFCFAKVLIGTLSQAVCRLQFWLFQDIVLVLRVAFWKLKLCAAGDGDLYSSTCHRVLTSCSSNPGRGLRRAPRLRNLSWVSGVRQRPRSRTRLPQSQPAALDHPGKHPAPVLFPRARKPVYVPGSASHTVSVASTQLCPWWIKAAQTTRKQKVTFQKTFFTEKSGAGLADSAVSTDLVALSSGDQQVACGAHGEQAGGPVLPPTPGKSSTDTASHPMMTVLGFV